MATAGHFFATTRQTARNAGDYEDAASGFLERVYADRSGASSGLSTTYDILFFVGFLAVCRTVDLLSGSRVGTTSGIGRSVGGTGGNRSCRGDGPVERSKHGESAMASPGDRDGVWR